MKPSCPLPHDASARAARDRQAQLTKPPGSLGRLEALAIQLAAWQAEPVPRARPAAVVLFAADHPVTRHGVSPYPSEVTAAMVQNFAAGGAAASVLCRAQGLPLRVVDVGVNGGPVTLTGHAPEIEVARDPVADAPVGDLRTEDAMSVDTFAQAVRAGAQAVTQLPADTRVVLLGEMGIGNTTAAAAVCAGLLGGDPADFVGAGTGAHGEALERKRAVVRDAVARLDGERAPLEVLRRVGGRDLAALFGALEAALARRQVVLVDGFIVTAAALVLCQLQPGARHGLVFAHRSDEQAHGRVLEHLEATPLLELGMRLGEASGALAAYPLLEHACALHEQMATFASAAVPDRVEP